MKNFNYEYRCIIETKESVNGIYYIAKIQRLYNFILFKTYINLEFPYVNYINIGDNKMYSTTCKETATRFKNIENATFCASKVIEDLSKNNEIIEIDY